MYGSSRNVANFYRRTEVSSAALGNDPHRLISLLLDGACKRLRLAHACIDRNDIPGKAKAISSSCAIISHLNVSLDLEHGGEVAANLAAIYDYILRRLILANLHSDTAIIDEVLGLIEVITSAWNAIPVQSRYKPQPATVAI
jgi:flagellar protein FliS